MHEVSLVAELVDECARRADGRRVAVVRVRHANTIPDDVLEQAFTLLTGDGPLTGARLEREEFEVSFTCTSCPYTGVLGHDHLVGHLTICPQCGVVSSAERVVELELLGVELVD